jgi:hypothetical protein
MERAIWLKMTGKTEAAREIFYNELKPLETVPVVAIEHADLELESFRWGRAWRILDSALQRLKVANADLDRPEHRLMAIARAMLGIRHRGDLKSSIVEIERTMQWLRDVPVADYTDVQVGHIIFSVETRLANTTFILG